MRKCEIHEIEIVGATCQMCAGMVRVIERLKTPMGRNLIDNQTAVLIIRTLSGQARQLQIFKGRVAEQRDGHWIPHELIKAAVEEGVDVYADASSFWNSLRMLHIHCCQRCEGEGDNRLTKPAGICESFVPDVCDLCHGNRFMFVAEGEDAPI